MLKPAILIGLLLITASCGQNGNSNNSDTDKDSSDMSLNELVNMHEEELANMHADDYYSQDTIVLPETLAAFIPEGYLPIDTASGDLNLDEYPDMIIVCKQPEEDSMSHVSEHPSPRPLLLLTGNADGSYTMAARNNNVVLCVNCGGTMGDPYMSVVIKNGYFSVEHYGGSAWRWTDIVTFKYSPEEKYWFLHKKGGDSFHATDPEKVTTTIKTTKDFGKVRFDEYDTYKDE